MRARPDNLSIPLDEGTPLERITTCLRDVTANQVFTATPVPDDALDALKFSTCVPRRLALRTLRERRADRDGVARVLAEPVRVVTLGA